MNQRGIQSITCKTSAGHDYKVTKVTKTFFFPKLTLIHARMCVTWFVPVFKSMEQINPTEYETNRDIDTFPVKGGTPFHL